MTGITRRCGNCDATPHANCTSIVEYLLNAILETVETQVAMGVDHRQGECNPGGFVPLSSWSPYRRRKPAGSVLK